MINPRQVIFPLFFLTGLAAMVYEFASVRQLVGICGGSGPAVSIMAAVGLVGIGLGGAVIGRLGDRVDDRLALFAGVAAFNGLCAILSTFLFGVIENLYYGGGYPHPALRITLSALYFVVPTFLLGGCLPVVAAAVARARSDAGGAETGWTAGCLFATASLGAAAGAALSGLVLLEHVGARASLFAAGGCHLAVAATIFLARTGARPKDNGSASGGPDTTPQPSVLARILKGGGVLFSGAVLSAFGLLWTRLLIQLFFDSVYSMTIVIVALVLSLAGGGIVGAWIARKRRNARNAMALCLLNATVAALALLCLSDLTGGHGRFPGLVLDFGGNESFSALFGFKFLYAICLVAFPALAMATAIPLAASLNWRSPDRTASHLGDSQFLFTAGAAAGILVTACVILPGGLGLEGAFLFAAGTGVVSAWLLLASRFTYRRSDRPRRTRRAPAHWLIPAVLTVAVILVGFVVPESFDLWNYSLFDRSCRYYREDGRAAVAVVEKADGPVVKVDGVDSLAGSRGELLEMRLGMLPGLLCGPSDRALCLGLGTGHSLMGLIGNGPREVDCLESIPGVIEASHYFHNFAAEVPRETRLNLNAGDVRVFLSSTDETYDLILGNPVDPSRAGAGFHYTREHFESVRDRLSEEGLFCQWIPLHKLHWEDFGIIGYTFSEVFDHMAVFLAYTETPFPFLGLVGTRQPLRIDPRAMQQRLDVHPYRTLLEKLELDNALENLSLYVNDQWLFRTRFPDPSVNTLDRPMVEFHAARLMERPDVLGFQHFLQLAEPQLNEAVLPLLDPARLEGQERRDFEVEIRALSDGMRQYLASHAYELWEMILQPIGAVNPTPEVTGELRRLFEKRFDLTIEAFSSAPEHRVLRRNLLRLWKELFQRNELVRAANLMAAAASKLPDDPALAFNWGLSYLLQEQYVSAATIFEKSLENDPDHFSARLHYAIALFCDGKRVKARDELDRALEAGGGMNRLSEFTRAMATLILEGHENARPLLERYESEGPWDALIDTAIDQSRARDRAPGESENRSGDETPR